jgi:hypothetical protein
LAVALLALVAVLGNLAAALLGLVFWSVILHGVKKKKRERESSE